MVRGRARRRATDRYAGARLASVAKRLAVLGGALLLVAGATAATLTPDQVAWYRARLGVSSASALPSQIAPADSYVYAQPIGGALRSDPLAEALVAWNRLRQSDTLLFSDYATFLALHQGWPGEAGLRKAAEQAIAADVTPPREVAAFFAKYPPVTNTGRARLAEALLATGHGDEATVAARAAWAGGQLSPADEARMLGRFGGVLTPDDQDAREERLLWDRATAAAQRQLAWTSAARQPIFRARIALQSAAPDAAGQAAALSAGAEQDSGYVRDRALWLRDSGQSLVARAYMGQPRRFAAPPLDPEKWMETRLLIARAAAFDGQWSTAYAIAAKADDAYSLATSVRERSYGERDDYTSLTWLAGTAALLHLGRPADAIICFQAYVAGSRSPQVQAKGFYWAGRAAQAAGRAADADGFYAQAAAHYDQFYGQLASERLGQPIPVPPTPQLVAIGDEERQRFASSEVVRAIRMLGELGDWQDQTQFVRALAVAVTTDADHLLAADLARDVGRPDLGVMVARAARYDGSSDYAASGFPEVPVPGNLMFQWTMIHAIMRQESQFDRQAVSHAGARGMMQLMPATAREWAGKTGQPYDYMRLTTDPAYNMTIGTAYFAMLLDRYAGNHMLAVAAYNAGPGNVSKWIAANGDPRLPGADVIAWIEAIPLAETRSYVQRVLENAVVYDLLNPSRARMASSGNRLSAYLGKTSAG